MYELNLNLQLTATILKVELNKLLPGYNWIISDNLEEGVLVSSNSGEQQEFVIKFIIGEIETGQNKADLTFETSMNFKGKELFVPPARVYNCDWSFETLRSNTLFQVVQTKCYMIGFVDGVNFNLENKDKDPVEATI